MTTNYSELSDTASEFTIDAVRAAFMADTVQAYGTTFAGLSDFDVAEALYYYLARNHGGQNTGRYQALSALQFKPGKYHTNPQTYDADAVYYWLAKRYGQYYAP